MKNSELDQLLKSAPVPGRPEAYWEEFHRQVLAKASSPNNLIQDDAGILAAGKARARSISRVCDERATPPAGKRTSQIVSGYLETTPKARWLQAHAQAGANRPRIQPFGHRLRFAGVVGLGLVGVALLLGLVFGLWQARGLAITDAQLAVARKYYQEIEPLFPNQVQAIAFDQQGPHLALAEQPNVPVSPPLYVRICGPNGCRNYVTFSGQQIRLNGEVCDVLLDHRGNVLLVGQQAVWSTAQAPAKNPRYLVAARPL